VIINVLSPVFLCVAGIVAGLSDLSFLFGVGDQFPISKRKTLTLHNQNGFAALVEQFGRVGASTGLSF